MRTEVLPVDPSAPEAEPIARAAEVLRRGGLVAFPTETVYGLGAHALDPAAVAGIFAAKGRPGNNPLIVHVADATEVQSLVADWPDSAAKLAARFWPGPLTLVLPKRPELPDVTTAGGPTVALRVPAHPVARALLRAAGLPIAAPSANRSSRLSPTLAEHVVDDLEGRIDLVLDGGPTPGGVESTVLDLTATPPRLLRPGLVTPSELEAVIGPIERTPAEAEESSVPLPSPGMLTRHYAPRKPLELVTDADRVAKLCQTGLRVGWLTLGDAPTPAVPGLTVVPMPTDPTKYAARLFATLHALDRSDVERIAVTLPPDTEAWLAVRDRLQRAAALESGTRR